MSWWWWTLAHAASPAVPVATETGSDDAEQWRATLDRVTRAVVSIRMDRPRAFEGVGRNNSQATGFVVDAELGLVLTNRHVVGTGPTTAQAVFLDNEEVDLIPVYRDPIHDFGLFRYDPAKLRFIHPEALVLEPRSAQVGLQIRVVGNDSGERLSILDGTIARLDRPAPVYGGAYSDYDTFYIQASSATSGGSSGSPVVDVHGDVVALNAGAKGSAATSFYLPLDRVVRAVDLVRRGLPVPRGTFRIRTEYTPFDELRRLGLSDPTESAARAARPDATGMLVVREVMPEGPADGRLRIGDVVRSVGGQPVPDFLTLEAMLDDHVGDTLPVVLERSGVETAVTLAVEDLGGLVPSRLLEVGGGVLHDLSIHQARLSQVPVRGVYVADPGRSLRAAGLGEGAVLIAAEGRPLAGLADLEAVLATVPDRAPIRLRWYSLVRPQQVAEAAVRMDRRWFPVRSCQRDDVTGTWPCTDLPGPEAGDERAPVPLDVGFPSIDDRRAERVQPSLVGVRTDVPYAIAGLQSTTFFGSGLVVDAAQGLVVVDRDTVPVALGEVRITVAGSFEIPARIVALHEVHDLAVIRYDPADLGGVPLASAEFAPEPLEAGDRGWFVGLESDGAIDTEEVEIRKIEPFVLPSSGAPRFRDTNLDIVELREPPSGLNGVVVDRKGRVGAFQASFSYNDGQQAKAVFRVIPADVVREVVDLARGETGLRTLGWELGVVPLPRAVERGLPGDEAERLVAHDPERRSVLQVVRLETGDPLRDAVRTGDLLLRVNGTPVTRFRQVDDALRGRDVARLTVCRDGGLVEVDAAPRPLAPVDVDRVILWAGVRVHAPDRSARLEGVSPSRPYVAWTDNGSPAGRAKLYSQRSILSVDGIDTPDLDAFVGALVAKPAGAPVRLELQTRTGEREVLTVEPDAHFFPLEELRWIDGGWERRPIR